MDISVESRLTSAVAIYYYTLGLEDFNNDLRKELYKLVAEGKSSGLHHKDIQECWEVYVFLQANTNSQNMFNFGNLPAGYLGNYSYVREWDSKMAEYNTGVLLDTILGLNGKPGYFTDLFIECQDICTKYLEMTGNKLMVILPRKERIRNLKEVEVNVDEYLSRKHFTENYTNYYKESVFYDLDEVLEQFKTHKRVKFKNAITKASYLKDYQHTHTKLQMLLKGLLMYLDLLNGYDWGSKWEHA